MGRGPERPQEPVDVGVPTLEHRPAPADGVHRPDASGKRIEFVQEGNDQLFVRNRDVGPQDSRIATYVGNRLREVPTSYFANHVTPLHAERLKSSVLHRGR